MAEKIVINGVILSAGAFSLHRLIRALQKKRGFAWATNAQLAEMMHYTSDYISHLLTKLDRAGLIYRHVEHDKETRAVLYRQLYAFPKAIENATKQEIITQLESDRTENGDRRRLAHNGLNIGIAVPVVVAAITRYGVEAVENALICVKASTSCNNPIKYFFAAIRKSFKPTARAVKRYFGKAFSDAKRHAVTLPKMNPIIEAAEADWRDGSLFKSFSDEKQALLLRLSGKQ